MENLKKIVIVGGGFGGIRVALDLINRQLPNTKIILISDKPHFEYHPTLYRVVAGRSPLEVCIPLREIFSGKNVEVLEDTIIKIDLKEKLIKGSSGSHYSFDFLILALGSETAYLNIPGLEKFSFGFKSINEALRLKRHLHELFESAVSHTDKKETVSNAHFVIIGGGASGTELAGELASYTKILAKRHHIDSTFVRIDIIEAAPRLLPNLPEDLSVQAQKRLKSLGVNIFLNKVVIKEEIESVYLKNMKVKTKTVIWTAGVKPNHLYSQTEAIPKDKKGRVLVDDFLQSQGWKNIFVIGDAASTPYSGMAQTALSDGQFVAQIIECQLANKQLPLYKPKPPYNAIPIGPGFALVMVGNLKFYGKIGWWLRKIADLRYFLSILPWRKAILVFQNDKTLCESCPICQPKKEIA